MCVWFLCFTVKQIKGCSYKLIVWIIWVAFCFYKICFYSVFRMNQRSWWWRGTTIATWTVDNGGPLYLRFWSQHLNHMYEYIIVWIIFKTFSWLLHKYIELSKKNKQSKQFDKRQILCKLTVAEYVDGSISADKTEAKQSGLKHWRSNQKHQLQRQEKIPPLLFLNQQMINFLVKCAKYKSITHGIEWKQDKQ